MVIGSVNVRQTWPKHFWYRREKWVIEAEKGPLRVGVKEKSHA
mgnify:CR=1 FL=1